MNMTSFFRYGFILLITSLVVVSCKKEDNDDGEEVPMSTVNYDAVLTNLLVDNANGMGLYYYILPESDNYGSIPQDPLNPINSAKVQLGKMLFHETALGSENKLEQGAQTYSCASCHHAAAGFAAGMRQGLGEGGMGFGIAGEGRMMNPDYPLDSMDCQPFRTPSALNTAYQELMLWNGALGGSAMNKGTEGSWGPGSGPFNNHFGMEGLETQGVAGLTVHRMEIDLDFVNAYPEYKVLFDQAFPSWPESTRYGKRTGGMAIAAYERTLLANEAPFQEWLKGDESALSQNQKKGAIVFFEKGKCTQCHDGPALSSDTFHALGMKDLSGSNIFIPEDSHNAPKGRGGFTQKIEDLYKFKTPQLYNMTDSKFFGHGGMYTTVEEVIQYKNNAVSDNSLVPESQLAESFIPLNLTDDEISQLVDFLENGLYDPNLHRYAPSEVISGSCIPNGDEMSMTDLGCEF